MLSFYHIRSLERSGIREEGGQCSQGGEIHVGGVRHYPDALGLPPTHPLRDLQHGVSGSVVEGAPKHRRAGSAAYDLGGDSAPAPRVPQVADFQDVGIMGVRSLGCTTAGALTRASARDSRSHRGGCQHPRSPGIACLMTHGSWRDQSSGDSIMSTGSRSWQREQAEVFAEHRGVPLRRQFNVGTVVAQSVPFLLTASAARVDNLTNQRKPGVVPSSSQS